MIANFSVALRTSAVVLENLPASPATHASPWQRHFQSISVLRITTVAAGFLIFGECGEAALHTKKTHVAQRWGSGCGQIHPGQSNEVPSPNTLHL
jgi:hypothetical protein